MTKVLAVAQEKGGAGKSTIVRAGGEAVPDAPVFELDADCRLVELGSRVRHFPVRATREEIERTGGLAARAEFDEFVDAIASATLPVLVDVGANTSAVLLKTLAEVADELREVGVEFGLTIVTTAEPGALASVPILNEIAAPWASARFLIENQLHGPVAPQQLERIADGATVTRLAHHHMDPEAEAILHAGGLASVPALDTKRLGEKYGLMRGLRIQRDLTGFRLAAMRAIEPAARWLVS
ncbi:hypothetical protein [Bradyrhizobium sp. cf659]|uniref:hypothetical protein n=1 Tax=Bradyrhizobium sp. cf659 TaxID=1761771 RepID=UPI0008E4C22E|nr:hypothetical protein [Bradyrhizobium sp. cf659]SFJ54206.1 hypothetical protein SAMN04487925_108288 [Bradyrhizobium sp. cf659]